MKLLQSLRGEAEMWLIGKLNRNDRGAGSIIGAIFILLILVTGFAFYRIDVSVTEDYTKTVQDMGQLDQKRNKEKIEFTSISITTANKLNITVKNTGSYQTHLIWLGLTNKTANTQEYFIISFYINPAETEVNVQNASISITEGHEYIIQLVTELGNSFDYKYPKEADGYDFVDMICDLYSPSTAGSHSLFSAQKAGPDGIMDTLTEGSSSSNETAAADLDRNDWISGQSSAGDVNAGALGNTDSSDDTRYELIETKATGGSPASRNYLLAWRFDFTSLTNPRANTHVYIEAQTTGETFRVYWSSDDSSMNYLGTITSSSDAWSDWDIPDDTSTTIYILFKDNNDDVADGSDTLTADIIQIDTLLIETAYFVLDLEVRWTELDFDETNEWICIYGGTMGSEDILVDIWNGTAWVNIFTDLLPGWNSVDISSYLISSALTIRFKGATETADAIEDTWEIDAAFVYAWT